MGDVGFDPVGLQVQSERQEHDRLSGDGGLWDVLERAGHAVSVLEDPLTLEQLESIDVLVLTTRPVAYQHSEADAILEWVRAGGSLWLNSNHGPFGMHRPEGNLVRYDITISVLFQVILEPSANYIRRKDARVPLHGTGPLFTGRPGWPALDGRDDATVAELVSANGCAILPAPWLEIVVPFVHPELQNRVAEGPCTPGIGWAATLEGPAVGEGRAVFCADSGWLGNVGSTYPGRGVFQLADNAQFALNIVSWLTEDRS